MSPASASPASDAVAPARDEWRTVLRHRWPLRLMHWINLACMLALVGSGLQIFNAHPALYWGQDSHFETPLVSISAFRDEEGRPIVSSLAHDSRRAAAQMNGAHGWSPTVGDL